MDHWTFQKGKQLIQITEEVMQDKHYWSTNICRKTTVGLSVFSKVFTQKQSYSVNPQNLDENVFMMLCGLVWLKLQQDWAATQLDNLTSWHQVCTTVICWVLEYVCLAWHNGITIAQRDNLQKRVVCSIFEAVMQHALYFQLPDFSTLITSYSLWQMFL